MTSDNVARRSAYPPVWGGQDDQYAAGHDSHSQEGDVTSEGNWQVDRGSAAPSGRPAQVPGPRPPAPQDGDFRLPGYSYQQAGHDAPGYGGGGSYPSGDHYQTPGASGNGTSHRPDSYGDGSYESGGAADSGYGPGEYGSAGYGSAGYGSRSDVTGDYPTGSYPTGSYPAGSDPAGDPATGGYATGGHATGDYGTGGYRSREPADTGYSDANYGSVSSADTGYGNSRYETDRHETGRDETGRDETGRYETGRTADTGYPAGGYGTGGSDAGYGTGGSDAGYESTGYAAAGSADAGYGTGGYATGGSDAGLGSSAYGTGGTADTGYAAGGYGPAGAAGSSYQASDYSDDRYGSSAGSADTRYGESYPSGSVADPGYGRRGSAAGSDELGYRDSRYGAAGNGADDWAETGSYSQEGSGYGGYGAQNGTNDYSASDPGSTAYRAGDTGTGRYRTGEYRDDQYRTGSYGDGNLAADDYGPASYRSDAGAGQYGADYATGSYGPGHLLDPGASLPAEPFQPRERGPGLDPPAAHDARDADAAGRYQPPGLPEAAVTGHGWPADETAGLAGPGRKHGQDQTAAWAGGPEPEEAWGDDAQPGTDDDPAGDDRLMAQLGGGGGRKPRRRRRRHRWILTFICIVILLVAALGLGMGARVASQWWTKRYGNYPGAGYGSVRIQVTAGAGATQLAPQLVSAGVIESAGPFITAASGSNTSVLQPGYYRMHYHMNAARAWALLISPSGRLSSGVTLPEGLRASQIVLKLSKASGIPASKFEAVLRHPAALGLPSYAKGNPEGYLFPATYPINPGETATQILQAMVAKFNAEATQLNLVQAAAKGNLPPAEVIIIASLVQAEAGKISDFGKISRVIDNRLNQHIRLQFDSTVLYGLNKYGIRATAPDLRSKSKYNTYRYFGLPPGPIGNPGELAIQAALHPPKGGWLYFITVDPATKLTKFTSSYAQFLQWERQAKNG